ncbi:hypothetical protein CEP54_012834 [Fusarium duplospermum]|uniref:Major facilitator superfamily (MFS) profile domain-containing protein n=1 Tax=Fusarium duplospermum TaxID=1325734 RepID=A0A428P6H0_9HYPO|nr:hypothetical protein CEP54_012834 [Fusarium duplospermum]
MALQNPEPTQKQETENQTTESPDDDILTYPEGGLRAWGVVFGSFCIMLSVFGVINTAAVFESYFKENQLKDKAPSTVAWIFSLYLFNIYFLGLLAGPIFDRHGHRLLIFVGSVLVVVSFMLLSLCSEYYQIILCFSMLFGIGASLMNIPAYAVIGHWFDKRRGFAVGVASTAGGIGGIIFPLVFQATLPSIGFAWSMRMLGFILLLLAVPSNLLIRTRLPPSEQFESAWPEFRLFKDPRLSLCCAGIFFMEYGILVPLTYVVSYATEHGHASTNSYMLPALLNAGSVVGRVVPGIISDRIGRFNVLIITVGACIICVLALWLPAGDSKPMLIAFTLLLGFASGGNVSLVPVCIGQLCDSKDYGRYLSTALLAASFGTLTGIPIGGALLGLGHRDGWLAVIIFSGASYAVSWSCYVAARILAVGWTVKAIY